MALTKQELLERGDTVVPATAARAALTEVQRQPHDDPIAALIDAEVFQALLLRRFGGHELDLDTHVAIIRRISSAGRAAAFCLGHKWMLTKGPEQALQEVLAAR